MINNKFLGSLGVALLIFLLIGCEKDNSEINNIDKELTNLRDKYQIELKKDENKDNVKESTKESTKDTIKFIELSSIEGKSRFSKGFQNNIEYNKKVGFESNNKTVYISLGEKTTGGYSIKILGLEKIKDHVIIKVKEAAPKDDVAVTQSISKLEKYIEISDDNFKYIKVINEGKELYNLNM